MALGKANFSCSSGFDDVLFQSNLIQTFRRRDQVIGIDLGGTAIKLARFNYLTVLEMCWQNDRFRRLNPQFLGQ